MGYKHSYDITSAAKEINAASYECASPYNDGYVAWGVKQDLYRLREILDSAIKRCPTFAPEEEWLREQEKKKVIGILKNDSHSR
jgi:hypothetical protein